MRKLYTATLLYILFYLPGYSQVPAIQWEQCALDGSYRSIAVISNTQFAIAGISYGCDVPTTSHLSLADASGNILWKKEYNFGINFDDYVYSVTSTPDNGFIFSCFENQYGLASYNLIVKTDQAGDTVWTKRISLGSYTLPVSSKVISTSDGGYCFVGSTYTSDLWEVQVIKLDEAGNIDWNHSYGGTSDDYGKDILQTNDEGFILAAYTYSNDGDVSGNHGENDVWIVKLNSSGVMEWQHCYGGTGNDEARSIVSTNNQGFAVLGNSGSTDGDVSNHHGLDSFYDYWLFKINSDGDLLWNNSYGGSFFEFASQLVTSENGDLIAAGSSYSNDGDVSEHWGSIDYDDMWLVCTDSAGIILWDKSCGGTDYDHGNAIGCLSETEWIIAGNSLSEDGDHHTDCMDSSCYPISGQWIVKLNSQCDAFPYAGFTYTQTGNTIHFTNTSTDATSYFWDFGDGHTSTNTSPNHNFDGNSTYTVCLVAYHNSCATDTFCQTIVMCDALNTDFDFTFAGLTVSFFDNTPNAAQWLWDFGDGATANTKDAVHTYASQGSYQVFLYTWDSCGSSYNTSKWVNTCNSLAAGFNYTIAGNTFSFSDLSVGEPNSWLWDFGDGSTSTQENPSHTFSFTTSDSFNVCLTIGHDECTNTSTQCQWVVMCPQVQSSFDFTTYDYEVSFENGSVNANSYKWDFGDGTSSSITDPMHTYPSVVADYDVCMIANGECTKDTSCQKVIVGKNPVTANFSYTTLGLTVAFTNLSTNAVTYLWDFGDGNTSTAVNPFHTYAGNGIYEVCLIATDQLSLSDTACQTIFLCTSFSGNYTYVVDGLSVSFTDESPNSTQWNWQFGDGSMSLVQNPTHTYPANGTYEACEITANICGYTDTICKTITVCGPIVPDFSYSDSYLSVEFTDLTASATSWLWIFDDGNTSTLQNPVHNYAGPGTYHVCLVVVDTCGNSGTVCKNVTVCTPIMADFSNSATNLTISFSDLTNDAVQWQWDFGDGATSTQQNPTHTYSANGIYEVCLTTTNVCGNSDSICQTITACQAIEADYTYTSSDLDVSFTDETPYSTEWVWYFGDNTANSFLQNPPHTYATAGTYNVCLVASDICNNSDLICKSVTVCAPIVVSFTTSEFYLTASFIDQTGSAVSWQWDFGDGGSATTQNPSHTYTANGTYQVCLTATDVCGNTDSICQFITVCSPLATDFSFSTSNLTATFSDLSNTATQWQWDFGDGNTSTAQNPVHNFAANGTYEVCLTATDLCGNSNTACQNVTVCGPLATNYSYSLNNLSVSFTDLSNSAIQWLWTFGDGDVSTDQNPTHIYASYGTYEVCLIAFNLCTNDTMCKSINVECPPFDAAFQFEVSNLIVSFSDLSTNATQWQWDFGDGTTSSIQNPVHVYTQEGEYTVCLIASDGCSYDTLCQTVMVVISGTEDINAEELSFNVYPNPLYGNGIIEFALAHASTARFDIYDVQGKNVFTTNDRQFGAGLQQVILPELNVSAGVYFIRMSTDKGIGIKKIVVQ